MRIAQLAAYHINVGDNIAAFNIRRKINALVDHEISWVGANILELLRSGNNIKLSVNFFKGISKDCDMLIIGGGGLIEGNPKRKYQTGYKLPFDQRILDEIDIPIVVCGVGVNFFRTAERESIGPKGLANLKILIDRCEHFSVRNDGSYEILKKYFPDVHIDEIPDPGLLFGTEYPQKQSPLQRAFFQPAWNQGGSIIKSRNLTQENLRLIRDMIKRHDMSVIPHCSKDYKFPIGDKSRFLWPLSDFYAMAKYDREIDPSFLKVFEAYQEFDYGVVMRGHGQLCSIGLNIPAIYLATQNKVSDFSKKHNFEDYTVDTMDKNWAAELEDKIDSLKNDETYLNDWYEIRGKNMQIYEKQFEDFCKKVAG
jgi:polysaccharide pyruvyl transferase WcaK-like protein